MTSRLTRKGYEELVQGDREWLMRQPQSLERDHIATILDRAVVYEYDLTEQRDEAERNAVVLRAWIDRSTAPGKVTVDLLAGPNSQLGK